MHLVAIAWIYVVLMMAVVEATAPNGTLSGALATLLLYGVLPLALVLYVLGAPARRRLRRGARDAPVEASGGDPDRGRHAPGDPVAPVREEP